MNIAVAHKTIIAPAVQDEQILRQLASELAKNYLEPEEILTNLGITHDEYLKLAQTSTFKTMLASAMGEWAKASNAGERVRLKSAWIIEEALPHLYATMLDTKESLTGRVEIFKTIAKIGGLGNPVAQENNGQVFAININMGGEKPPVTVEYKLPPKVIDTDYEEL